MIGPERNDVMPLAQYDEERFARWLERGFTGYFGDHGFNRHAFLPMQSFVGLEPDLVQDIAKLYRLLEPVQHTAFRAGLAMALARTPFEDRNILAVEGMLGLASAVGAPEILPVISEKHRMLWLSGQAEDEELFDSTLRCIVSLAVNAGPTPQTDITLNLLQDFASADSFPPEYAEAVLLAMCRVRPIEAWQNLQQVRRHLEPWLGPADEEEEEKHRIAARKRLVDRVYQNLAQDHFTQMLRTAFASLAHYDEDWFVMAALGRERRGRAPAQVFPEAVLPEAKTPPVPAPPVRQPPPSVAANDTTQDLLDRYMNIRSENRGGAQS